MKLAILAAMALALAPMAANAQAAAAPREARIVVMGSATIERTADWVTLSMTVRGEGATQVEALKALEAARNRIQSNIAALPGLNGLAFTADSLRVQDIRGAACGNRGEYSDREVLSQGACAVVGTVAVIDLDVRFAPASKVGDVAAFAAQLGGKDVTIEASGLTDSAGLREQALRAAFLSAQAEAQAIAAAAGGRLGPVVSVQDTQVGSAGSEQLELTATLTTDTLLNELPAVRLDLAAPPVTATARITVEFRLER